jgi:hypothetical protein
MNDAYAVSSSLRKTSMPTHQLTIDEAIAEFQAVVREELGDGPSDAPMTPRTPQEEEESRFRFAEFMLSLACPDPRACTDHRCRRNVACRHFERVQAKRLSGKTSHPRRTPGAEAARYAIWVYMSSGR